MSSTFMPPLGSVASSQMDLFQPAMLTSEASLTSSPATLPATTNATSLQALAGGRTRSISPGGPLIALSGPALARASRSRLPAKVLEPVTNGICGPTSFASSVPAGPLWSWENRLRERLASVGSTEFLLTWKVTATPAGRSVSRLVPLMRPTSAAEPTGAPWPTPTVADVQGGRMTRSGARNNEPLLNGLMPGATWATPTLCGDYNRKGASATSGDGLRTQMRMAHGGPMPILSPATTGKRGVPNPAFPCWLQGFPSAWLSGAASATPSSRRSRPKSSLH